MRSRKSSNLYSASLMGLVIGVAAGLAAGLLAAPMHGSAMRATLRQRASDGGSRLQQLLEEGRSALRSRFGAAPEPLTASVGEIASMHGGSRPTSWEVLS